MILKGCAVTHRNDRETNNLPWCFFLLVLTCLPVVPVPSWMKITRNTPNKAGFAEWWNSAECWCNHVFYCSRFHSKVHQYWNEALYLYRHHCTNVNSIPTIRLESAGSCCLDPGLDLCHPGEHPGEAQLVTPRPQTRHPNQGRPATQQLDISYAIRIMVYLSFSVTNSGLPRSADSKHDPPPKSAAQMW